MPIGENISKISKKKNISFYKIAKNSKVSESYINDIIHGRKDNPSIKLLKRIAATLNVSVQELIEEKEMN
ncbi:helix-turn-helix domain-containing protein [Clostridium kluyveri]|uniref:helix-turn-helix domain-containing protein n=1 Tax=Clostridium kluyveri TaxID=1534 RepID=UPI002248211B|nr:helix-turn-helix transcriptional regulator [Clostridium kluyveri]UZQ50598.1 helix-turn-helix domain-containing protein [Clostridium kluyveri]